MKTLTQNKPDRLAELREKHEAEMKELTQKEEILSSLPENVPFPTVSNISRMGNDRVRAWLSFSPEYGQDTRAFALGIFQALEKAGAKPLPVSLCQYGTWRRSVSPGLPDEQPDNRRGDELKDVEPVAPLWVVPCQFTGVEALCFYEIAGYIYRVAVKAPLAARLSCRKVENFGGWRFDGACTVAFPDNWHALYSREPGKEGECVAHVSQHTRGYKDTEQGITGVIYFQPLTEQESFPLSPAQMMEQLL